MDNSVDKAVDYLCQQKTRFVFSHTNLRVITHRRTCFHPPDMTRGTKFPLRINNLQTTPICVTLSLTSLTSQARPKSDRARLKAVSQEIPAVPAGHKLPGGMGCLPSPSPRTPQPWQKHKVRASGRPTKPKGPRSHGAAARPKTLSRRTSGFGLFPAFDQLSFGQKRLERGKKGSERGVVTPLASRSSRTAPAARWFSQASEHLQDLAALRVFTHRSCLWQGAPGASEFGVGRHGIRATFRCLATAVWSVCVWIGWPARLAGDFS